MKAFLLHIQVEVCKGNVPRFCEEDVLETFMQTQYAYPLSSFQRIEWLIKLLIKIVCHVEEKSIPLARDSTSSSSFALEINSIQTRSAGCKMHVVYSHVTSLLPQAIFHYNTYTERMKIMVLMIYCWQHKHTRSSGAEMHGKVAYIVVENGKSSAFQHRDNEQKQYQWWTLRRGSKESTMGLTKEGFR